MLFSWNRETIGWFKAASAYTGFHQQLAGELLPLLEGCGRLYDMGCGLALLPQQLCRHVKEVVCVDTNEAALDSLRQDLAKASIGNIRVRQADCMSLQPDADVIMLSYFGGDSIARFLPYCRRLIAIMDWDENSSLAGELDDRPKRRRHSALQTAQQLTEEGIPHSCRPVSLEFGQPFRSIEDGLAFMKEYYGLTPLKAGSYLEQRARNTGIPQYPYYLPYLKQMGIVVVEGRSPA